MSDFALVEGQRWSSTVSGDSFASGPKGTSVNSSASANTKGSWATLYAAASNIEGCEGFWLNMHYSAGQTNQNTDFLMDIGIGAAASEQVVISNLLFSKGVSIIGQSAHVFIPMALPAGERIAARVQTTFEDILSVSTQIHLMNSGFLTGGQLGRCTTYGAVTADSGGTSHTTGTTNTKGTYTQLTASTTSETRAVILAFGTQGSTSRANQDLMLDFSVGASGSENKVVENIPLGFSQVSDGFHPMHAGPYYVNIPSGSRLSVRAASGVATQALDVVAYCFD